MFSKYQQYIEIVSWKNFSARFKVTIYFFVLFNVNTLGELSHRLH